MYLQPVVRCKNRDCPMPSAARIRLPYPNPPATGENPPAWPQDAWQLRMICRECEAVDCRKRNRKQEQPGPQRAAQVGVGEQVMRQLGDGEDVHQVEEQLDVRDPLHAGPVPQQSRPMRLRRAGRAHQA